MLCRSGRILVAFQSGDNDLVESAIAYGSASTLTLYRHRVDDVVRSLDRAGFEVLVHVRRKAALSHETTPQAVLLAFYLVERAHHQRGCTLAPSRRCGEYQPIEFGSRRVPGELGNGARHRTGCA